MSLTRRPAASARRVVNALGLRRGDVPKIAVMLAAALVLTIVAVVAVTRALSDRDPAWWVTAFIALGGAAACALWSLRVLVTRRRAKVSRSRAVSKVSTDTTAGRATVTVVIPAFCEAERLATALDSLRAQTYPLWRAIVVDDQSSDDTSRVGVLFAQTDPRVSVLRLRRNSGLPAARNAGLTQVDTPYVLFLDGDDAMFPEALQRRVELLEQDHAAAGAYGESRQVAADADWRVEASRSNRGRSTKRITLISSGGENAFGIHEVLLRTEKVLELGGFTEHLRGGGEDVDFWLRALRSGHEFAGTGNIDCLYRQTPTSMVSAGATAHLETVVGLLEAAWHGDACHAEVTHRSGLDGELGNVLRRGLVEGRLLRYLGMAAQAGDRGAQDHVLGRLAEHAPLALSREAALSPLVNGARRTLKRNGAWSEVTARETGRSALTSIDHLFGPVASAPLPRRDHPSWAVLVENRAQVTALCDALASTPAEEHPAYLVADSVDADMGAFAALRAAAPSAVWRSVPNYALEGVAYDVVVLPRPITWVSRLVAEIAGERGSELRELELPWSGAVTVDDEETREGGTNELESPAARVSLGEVATLARPRRDVIRHKVPARRRALPGLSDQAGAQGDYRGLDLPTTERLMALRDRHKGERCVIIGNGPSLNKTDLDLLRGTATFGVNGIYYADTRLPEPLTFYVVEDTKVFEENTPDVLAYGREKAGTFILPTLYRPSLGPDDDPVLFRMNGGFYRSTDPSFARPRFSTNAAEVLYCGQSVTLINLQLAYWMGFSEVGLIGMDFSYAIPQGTKISGNLYTSAGDDPNHFDSRYFGAGKTWKDPKLNRVLANYNLAKAIYESDGRRIVNCTVGGALEAFTREDLADFTSR